MVIKKRQQTRRPDSLSKRDLLRLTLAVTLVLLAGTVWRHAQSEAPSVRDISAQHYAVPAGTLETISPSGPSA